MKIKAMDTRWIAALGAICCMILPVAANAYTVGERGEAGSVFL